MVRGRAAADDLVQPGFNVVGVGEVDVPVDAQRGYVVMGLHIVAAHGAKALRPADAPHQGDVRPAGAAHEEAYGQQHAGDQAGLHAEGEHRGQGDQFGNAVLPIEPPVPHNGLQVDQAHHEQNHHGGQNGLGQAGEQGRQEQHNQQNDRRAHQRTDRRAGAGLVVHAAARKAAGHRGGAGAAGREVGGAQGQKLLVVIKPGVLPRRQ